MVASSWEHIEHVLTCIGPGVDIAELCGGDARSTKVAIRRRLVGGRNYDFVTQVDLGCPQQQIKTLQYLKTHPVLVLIMAPQSRTYKTNYDTWIQHYNEDMPHVRFCARAAWFQLEQGRSFLASSSFPTWLIKEPGWREVIQDRRVKTTVFDQCRTNLRMKKQLVVLART